MGQNLDLNLTQPPTFNSLIGSFVPNGFRTFHSCNSSKEEVSKNQNNIEMPPQTAPHPPKWHFID